MVDKLDMEGNLIRYFNQLDRSVFIPEAVQASARWDVPLPIGFGQTISQPSLVLEMTLQLDLKPDQRVLEIGTGSGYQTAFLAEFAQEVFTVERHEALSISAQGSLSSLGYDNVVFRVGDGSLGWPEEAPFDRIMVTAAAGKMPTALMEQLKSGGKMVIPVGPREVQKIMLIHRLEDGSFTYKELMAVQFVEFIGEYGWKD